MKVLKGISVSSGIAKGKVCLYSNEVDESLPHYQIKDKHIPKELNRLDEARIAARTEMDEMAQLAERQLDKEARDIFNAYLAFLNDKGLYKKISGLIKKRKINAEHAVNDVFEEYIKIFQAKDSHFNEMINDFVDIRNRLIGAFNLTSGKFKCTTGETEPVIVVSERLTPSMVLNIQKENVLAFVTEHGGFTNHATILARSYGVPNIYGIDIADNLDCGMEIIVDGSMGKVIVSPDEKTGNYYDRKIETFEQKKKYCLIKKDHEPKTKEGMRIKLKLNISILEELNAIEDMPYDGIGLLRTEFLFVRRDDAPSEEEQYEMYKNILQTDPEKPVSIRLLDIGLDKMPEYFKLIEEMAHEIELRGAVAVEVFPDIYINQVKALLRAGAGMTNLQVLYPMVSDLHDLETFRNIFKKARKILRQEKVEFYDGNIKEGVMIETPSAVMMVEELLEEVDFINIGSNDLLQYSMAAFRGESMVEDRYHILHPTLVKMMEIITKAGRKAGKEVCLCGEIAFFEEFYPLFLQMGLRSFSVAVTKFNDIKCELMNLNIPKNEDMLKDFYKIHSKEKIREYFIEKI
ncbi:MAG: phosphoenolpyruvate--protein phosphotransferase [Elusimicrobia bacterium]|jgi:phosphotransferase system enzyme I (PtsI)|nr:phosphoenolpyruvate--protein phosphotransferase [Elusimicrobiota bacterium]